MLLSICAHFHQMVYVSRLWAQGPSATAHFSRATELKCILSLMKMVKISTWLPEIKILLFGAANTFIFARSMESCCTARVIFKTTRAIDYKSIIYIVLKTRSWMAVVLYHVSSITIIDYNEKQMQRTVLKVIKLLHQTIWNNSMLQSLIQALFPLFEEQT